MTLYRIEIKQSAKKELAQLPTSTAERLLFKSRRLPITRARMAVKNWLAQNIATGSG